MRILCIGGGPAGLYFALLAKQADPAREVRVVERNRPGDTFGWGVVFSDQTLGNLEAADPGTAREIAGAFNHWDDIDVHFRGRTITSGGHGFCGIGRRRLLDILTRRCESLGVDLRFATDVADDEAAARAFGADLVIASDGINSRVRARYAATYAPDIETRRCRFVWLGTRRPFKAFTFAFEETEHGWFQAHAYQYDADTSTFIVEAPEDVWARAGLEGMSQEEGIAFCERLFAKYLDGHRLMSNASHLRGSAIWIRFPRVVCRRWTHWREGPDRRRVPFVLLGDAAHTAHFSIGSGTKLAFEDGIALARELAASPGDLAAALGRYQDERSVEVAKLQNAARNSTEWFENVERYTALEAEQFAYSLLTRSQRISHENLRVRDPGFVARMEALVRRARRPAGRAGAADVHAVPAARARAAEPRRGLADGAVFVRRRDAGRLLPGAPRQPCARRCRPGLHRDGVRLGRCAHLARMRGPLRRRARGGVAAHRRLRARADAGEGRAAARPRGPQGIDAARLGGCRAAAAGRAATP